MIKLAIIGANEYQKPLILKAKERNIETHVFAWEDGAIAALDADYFYPISIVERDQILEECMKIGINGITSIGSDLAVNTMNYVAEKMGLAGNSLVSSSWCTNKYLMRSKFEENGIPVPKYMRVASAADINIDDFHFPVIVKPTDRSGSRAINKLNSPEGLQEAVLEACSVSFERRAIVEEFFEGPEFSCECISYQGKHTLLAVTQKYTTGEPHFIETGHMQPANLSREDYDVIRQNVYKALTALEIRNGASHSEIKYQNGEVRFIEIGARMGGDFIGSDLVQLSTGKDFLGMVIDVALGRAPDLRKVSETHRSYVRFILNIQDIKMFESIKKSHTVVRYSQVDYTNLNRVIDSSTRLGYYIYIDKEPSVGIPEAEDPEM